MHQESVCLLQPTILVSRVCGVCPSALRRHYVPTINKIYSFFLALSILVPFSNVISYPFSCYNDITAFIFAFFFIFILIQHFVLLFCSITKSNGLVRFFMIIESAQRNLFNLNIRQPHTPEMTSQICWMVLVFSPVVSVIVLYIYTGQFFIAITVLILNMVVSGSVCLLRVLMQLVDDKFSLLNWHLDDLNNRWPLFLPRPPDVSFRQLCCVAQWRSTKFVLPSQDTRTVTTDKVKDFNKAHLKLYYAYKTLISVFSILALTLPLTAGCSLTFFTFSLFAKISVLDIIQTSIAVLGFINNVLNLTVLLTLASRIEKQNRQTALLVHDLLDEERHSPEVVQELENFSLALLHRKANFSAAGFFDFNLKLVSRMASLLAPIILFLVQNNNRPRAGRNKHTA